MARKARNRDGMGVQSDSLVREVSVSYETKRPRRKPSSVNGVDSKTQVDVYASSILAAVHETAEDLHSIGLVDKTTMRHFDETCLVPLVPIGPGAIKALRERERASQAVLARYLGVATATLSQWERGLRKPDGPALRLLSLIDRHGLDYIL